MSMGMVTSFMIYQLLHPMSLAASSRDGSNP
jgi:hypothetical protein